MRPSPMSPSRNAPCPCGSRKKYKYCHGSKKAKNLPLLKDANFQQIAFEAQKKFEDEKKKEAVLHKAMKIFEEKERQRQEFTERYGQIRKPNFIKVGNTAYVAIGNEIYVQTRPGPYNFVNAVHDYGLTFFGVPFLEAQEAKPFNDRHPAMQWLHVAAEEHNKIMQNPLATPEDFSTGAMAAWGRLAYDLYIVKDNAIIEKRMKERLFDEKYFQGARYELAIIALFVAAGFDIEFEDEQDNTQKHSEFIATHKKTGIKIAVEAKSRHRYGVKGFTSGHKKSPGEKVNIKDLVLSAYQKKPNFPFYVFVDANLPPGSEDDQKRWFQEIHDTMQDLAAEGYANPCPANGVFFVNDPSHYDLTGKTVAPSSSLWIKHYVAVNPTILHPIEIDVPELILKAHTQRRAPPEDIPQ